MLIKQEAEFKTPVELCVERNLLLYHESPDSYGQLRLTLAQTPLNRIKVGSTDNLRSVLGWFVL